jgi:hypothetical protein
MLALTIAFSCREGARKEKDILTHDQMVKELVEIYVAEDKIQRLSLEPDSSAKVFEIMRKKIESKTGIADSVFKKSLDYYVARPKEMEQIYTALVDSLNLKEQRASFRSH